MIDIPANTPEMSCSRRLANGILRSLLLIAGIPALLLIVSFIVIVGMKGTATSLIAIVIFAGFFLLSYYFSVSDNADSHCENLQAALERAGINEGFWIFASLVCQLEFASIAIWQILSNPTTIFDLDLLCVQAVVAFCWAASTQGTKYEGNISKAKCYWLIVLLLLANSMIPGAGKNPSPLLQMLSASQALVCVECGLIGFLLYLFKSSSAGGGNPAGDTTACESGATESRFP